MRRLRVACFGAGWVTTHRHIPAMRATGHFDVVALVDRHGDRARGEAERLGVPHAIEGDSVDALGGIDVDAVACGTAPFGHHAVVTGALRAGLHAITEKPFAMTVAEGEEMAELAASQARVLAVVHNFQFARSTARIDAWLRRGRLGAPRALWALQLSNPRRRLPVWYEELPLGLFYDESPHLLYLLRHFAGGDLELDTVSVVPDAGRATPAQLTVQYRAPLPATLSTNFVAPVSEWQVAVLGEEAAAVVDVFRDIALLVPNDHGHGTRDVARTSWRAGLGHLAGYLRSGPGHLRGTLRYGNDEVFRRFAHACATGTPPRGIAVSDALAVLRAQHEILDAASGKPG